MKSLLGNKAKSRIHCNLNQVLNGTYDIWLWPAESLWMNRSWIRKLRNVPSPQIQTIPFFHAGNQRRQHRDQAECTAFHCLLFLFSTWRRHKGSGFPAWFHPGNRFDCCAELPPEWSALCWTCNWLETARLLLVNRTVATGRASTETLSPRPALALRVLSYGPLEIQFLTYKLQPGHTECATAVLRNP